MKGFGLALVLLSIFNLVITLATDSIPANWPFEPKHRDDHPDAFRLWLYAVWGTGLAGVMLVALRSL